MFIAAAIEIVLQKLLNFGIKTTGILRLKLYLWEVQAIQSMHRQLSFTRSELSDGNAGVRDQQPNVCWTWRGRSVLELHLSSWEGWVLRQPSLALSKLHGCDGEAIELQWPEAVPARWWVVHRILQRGRSDADHYKQSKKDPAILPPIGYWL